MLLLLAGVVVLALRHSQVQQAEQTLRLSASEVVGELGSDESDEDDDEDDDDDSTPRLEPDISPDDFPLLLEADVLVWVFDRDGDLALMLGDADDHAPVTDPNAAPVNAFGSGSLGDGTPVRYTTARLVAGDAWLGTALLAVSVAESERFIAQLVSALAVALPVVIVLSAVGGVFLANRALAPVGRIVSTARQISADDLSQRLNFALPADEVGTLARTFDDMLDRLEHAFERERQLTADVSHELRTPLGALKMQLSLARSQPRDSAALLTMFASMEGDIDRMSVLVEQLLTLARAEQYRADDFAAVNLNQVLLETVAEFHDPAHEQQLALALTLPDAVIVTVQGNAHLLRQIFQNLVQNALKYTPGGGHVTVALSHTPDRVTVAVADDGVGIAPKHLPHIFERFYRADDDRARKTGGFGLGLALTRMLVDLHGGDITVDSAVGAGTTFRVTLPVAAIEPLDAETV